jgi:hypothetical protein
MHFCQYASYTPYVYTAVIFMTNDYFWCPEIMMSIHEHRKTYIKKYMYTQINAYINTGSMYKYTLYTTYIYATVIFMANYHFWCPEKKHLFVYSYIHIHIYTCISAKKSDVNLCIRTCIHMHTYCIYLYIHIPIHIITHTCKICSVCTWSDGHQQSN